MGFNDINPENVPKRRKVSKKEKRRLELANALIPLKKIKVADKAEIYAILTGKDYPVKRGRPSTHGRDFEVAIDFLYLMGETADSAKTIMQRLAKIYDLPGGDIEPERTEREITDTTFNKIVVQHLDKIDAYFSEYVDAIEYGALENEGDSYKNAKICLQGLSRYKASKNKK